MEHRHDADGEVARDAAADLEKSDRMFAACRDIPIGEGDHIFNARPDRMDIFDISLNAVGGIHVAEGRIFPAWHEHGETFLFGGEEPAVFGIDLITGDKLGGVNNFPEKFVREEGLASDVGGHPFAEDDILDTPHGFHFRNAGIGDTVHVAGEESLFVRRGEVAVVRDAFVEIVGDEIEDILFKIGTRADDAVDFVLTDHFGE